LASKMNNPHKSKFEQIDQLLKGAAKGEQRRRVEKVNKKLKRNRDERPPRRRDWLADNADDNAQTTQFERIMPPGEASRRKAVLAAAAKNIEDMPAPDEVTIEAVGTMGTIFEISTGSCRVRIEGRELLCTLRGSLSMHDTAFTNVIAIGDEVIVTEDGLGGGAVEKVLPRRSALTRLDTFNTHLRQIIAANVDQLLIIASWRNPNLWPELVDRYLIAAERNNLTPILVVNKIDLAEDISACKAFLQPYFDLDLRVMFTSAHTQHGIEELRSILQGCSTVLAGLSGVGKSSLISAVQPGLQLRTHEVSETTGHGQHTTTQATMLPLENGGYVIDTPGIREFGLHGLNRNDLMRFYPELEAVADRCHFRNCAHISEPGCAVRLAVNNGTLPLLRFENYRKIYESIGG
jgi:ribosome biogenesis GTPase